MDMNTTPEPYFRGRLPAELEWEIFSIAVQASPDCIPKIVLVAHRFRIWFEPELYRIMRSGEGKIVPPLSTVPVEPTAVTPVKLDLPRLQRYGPHIRHILLQKRSAAYMKSVLQCCPNVINLALWIVYGTCNELLPILEKMPLQRLSLDPSYFFENYAWDLSIPFDQPLFHNVTHLEIINVTSSWSKWRQLALLPRLSHLALAGVVTQPFIDRVLNECGLLELFILFYSNFGLLHDELDMPQRDHRVVFVRSVDDHLDHWERGARGGEDFWITGEKLKQKLMQQAAPATGPLSSVSVLS